MKLKLQTVAPKQGMAWVQGGIREMLRRPLSYLSVLGVFMLALMFGSAVPVLGPALLLMAVPLLTLAFMMATRASLGGHPPGPGVYLAPWVSPQKHHRKPLLMLCVAYALLSAVAVGLGEVLDNGALGQLFEAINDPKRSDAEVQALAEAPGLLAGILVRLGLTVLISLPFWHAPALVVWAGQGPAQAMFSSTLALWRARWAFLIYGAGWVGVSLVAFTAATLVAGLLGGGALGSVVLVPIGLAVTCAYYASQFFSFQDCFAVEIEAGDQPADAGGPAA